MLLSASKVFRRRMRCCSVFSGDKELGGEARYPGSGRAFGCHSPGACWYRVWSCLEGYLSQVHVVDALPFGFLKLVGLIRSEYFLAGHTCGGCGCKKIWICRLPRGVRVSIMASDYCRRWFWGCWLLEGPGTVGQGAPYQQALYHMLNVGGCLTNEDLALGRRRTCSGSG